MCELFDPSSVERRVEETVERLLRPVIEKLRRKLELPAQEWFSIKQTAALTGLSEDHVRRHVTAGLLPVVNQGTFEKPHYLIHRPDIDKWMEERKERPIPAPRKKKVLPGPGSYLSRHHKNGAA